MEIGLVYSSKDPRQTRTRDFVRKYCKDRGILASFIEHEQPVEVPKITINGCGIDLSQSEMARGRKPGRFPSIEEIGHALEKSFWCL